MGEFESDPDPGHPDSDPKRKTPPSRATLRILSPGFSQAHRHWNSTSYRTAAGT